MESNNQQIAMKRYPSGKCLIVDRPWLSDRFLGMIPFGKIECVGLAHTLACPSYTYSQDME
jgi:hypothetical protein